MKNLLKFMLFLACDCKIHVSALLISLAISQTSNASQEVKPVDATLRILNNSCHGVTLQSGPVVFFCQWSGKIPTKQYLESGEAVEKFIPCNTKYCVYAKRHLLVDEDALRATEFFLKKHGALVISVTAYGITMIVTSQIADEIRSKLLSEFSESLGEESVHGLLKTVYFSVYPAVKNIENLESKIILENILSELTKLYEKSEKQILDYMKGDLITVLIQKSLIKLIMKTVAKSRLEWLNNFIDEYPEITKNVTSFGGLYLSKVVWKQLEPRYIAFLTAHPLIVGKKIICLGLADGENYYNQTSPYGSFYFRSSKEFEYLDGELIEVIINNYGHKTIKISQL